MAKVDEPFDYKSTIYLGNLNFRRDEKGIKFICSDYGVVKKIRIVIDLETNQSKGFAFIEMENEGQAERAVKALNGKSVDGRVLKASIAIPQRARPKRMEGEFEEEREDEGSFPSKDKNKKKKANVEVKKKSTSKSVSKTKGARKTSNKVMSEKEDSEKVKKPKKSKDPEKTLMTESIRAQIKTSIKDKKSKARKKN
jgi:RNA recognition motif-containing protein